MPDGTVQRGLPNLGIDREVLAAWLGEKIGAKRVRLSGATLLPGGAVQHNWRLDLSADGIERSYVLRSGPDIPLPESLPKEREFALLRHAHAAGVPVAEPLWLADDWMGPACFVSAHCRGDARRDRLFADGGTAALLSDLGAALARIHDVLPGDGDRVHTVGERVAVLAGWQEHLDGIPEGVQDGLRWLEDNKPDDATATLVHRDFRTGNFLVDAGRLVAVLDWEFAGWGDPHEDIGWFCAACWRGGAHDREAGGIGSRDVFYRAYTEAGGSSPDPSRVRYWEVFAHVRWALIALQQGARARAGAYPAWELEEAAGRVPALSRAIVDLI